MIHLNDDQFAASLDQGGDPSVEKHLAECLQCRLELESFRNSIGSFNRASLSWSERQPARQGHFGSQRPAWLSFLAWGAALCCVLLLVFSVAHDRFKSADKSGMDAVAARRYEPDSAAEIAKDNLLMLQVTSELNRREASPVSEYGLSEKNAAFSPGTAASSFQ